MKRAAPWIVAASGFIACGAALFQVHAARERYFDLLIHRATDHAHRDVRDFMIRAALADASRPIVVLGDSVTEMARLPETLDGHPVVNAGIGGATIEDFQTKAPELLKTVDAQVVVVALGANNIGSTVVRAHYAKLLARVKTLAPHVLAVGVASLDGSDAINAQIREAAADQNVPFVKMSVPASGMMVDRIHLTAAGYRVWTPTVTAAIMSSSVGAMSAARIAPDFRFFAN